LLPGLAEIEPRIPVDVIGMHLNFYGFSDEAVHVAGFAVFILIISSV
jgi:hypothetical protein